MEEVWKVIDNYNPYEVSNIGRVRRFVEGKGYNYLTPYDNHRGYLYVNLSINGKKKRFAVHKLVAISFIPNLSNKPQIDHINGDKKDNVVTNLRWCTCKENINYKNWIPKRRKRNMTSDKITTEDIQNLAKGILKVTLPDYKACRTAMSLITYTKDTWDATNEPKPSFESKIDKGTNTITITLIK